jgi:uncharacterized protein (DUF1501 family)
MRCPDAAILDRRRFLTSGSASLALWSLMPRQASAASRDPRLLVVILRGGLDGLAAVAPIGDPQYGALRGELALAATGDGAALPLDGTFALNGMMPNLAAIYARKQALIVHAVHTPYRERSHFDGQDVLESGLPGFARSDDGWLNRALAQLPNAGRADPRGLTLGAMVPLMMRGEAPVLSWIPKVAGIPLRESTIARLTDLYAQTDPALARAFAQGLRIGAIADESEKAAAAAGVAPQTGPKPHRDFVDPAEAAARFMANPSGPRIGVLSYNGWDTHAFEGPTRGQLANRLAGLDAALMAFANGMGPAWKDTVCVVVTEFGRTVRVNGTAGTDHGMATSAFLVGGALAGGRVIADWPGLAEQALYEGRDLKPTLDLRAVLKGVLRDHVGLPDKALNEIVFPSSAAIKPMQGLVA